MAKQTRNKKSKVKHRNWKQIIERFGLQKGKRKRIALGSPGSAQVTRVRLTVQFPKLQVRTVDHILILEK